MIQVPLGDIVTDAGTQVRATIDLDVVNDYAAAMGRGDVFPPIILVNDGVRLYLADGFHRLRAAALLQLTLIAADVCAGTRDDALWYALGANKGHGQRLTDADKRRAILLALKVWPDRSATIIAEQIGAGHSWVSEVREQVSATGNLPARVTGKDGKTYPAQRQATPTPPKQVSKTKAAIAERRSQIAEMAADGYTSPQIAAVVGMGASRVRLIMRAAKIPCLADQTVGGTMRKLDPNRYLGRLVDAYSDMPSDLQLVDFDALDRAQIPDWIASLRESSKALGLLITRLQRKVQHVRAADTPDEKTDPPRIEDPSGPDSSNGRPARVRQSATVQSVACGSISRSA